MEVEEQEAATDGAILANTPPPVVVTGSLATTSTVSSGTTAATPATTTAEVIEEDTFESLPSGVDSEEMLDALSSPGGTEDEAPAEPQSSAINLESHIDSVDMVEMDRAPEIGAEVNAVAENGQLAASDTDDDWEEDDEDDDQEDGALEEDDMDEFNGVSVDVDRMLLNALHRNVDDSGDGPIGRNEGRGDVNARRANNSNRQRILFPLSAQHLVQIRRALLSVGSNLHSRIGGRRATAGDADPEGDAESAPNEDDDHMGENDDNESQEREPEPENPIRFDTDLPAEHSYLGTNMNRVSGVEYLDVGDEFSMMLFLHQHIVYPGEVLPFMISGTIIDADIDSTRGLLFGVCFPFMRSQENENNLYGVTCQIYEKGSDERGNTLIKSRALQRFVTTRNTHTLDLEFINNNPRLNHGYIRILPEIYLPEPLSCINMGSMNRFRHIGSMENEYRRYQAATTCWPAHIYRYYDISSIVEKARKSLEQHKIDTMPTDPIQLSYWLARNLHLSEEMMKNIFMTDTVNLRMKLIATTFKEETMFVCRICGNRIANCSELFAMSKHGVQTQYCNSAGYIHETNTVYQLLRDAVSYSGDPSSEFSWFPGYTWQIILCKVCSRHIGWKFKAMEANLVPKSFFGISSSSVRISDSNRAPTNPRQEIFRSIMRLSRQNPFPFRDVTE